jgi:C4-type Zn-finger protein
MADLELCPKCGKGYLRPTAEAAIMSENTEPFRETSDMHSYVCDNCGHKKAKAVLREYVAISDSVTAKVIKAEDRKDL